MGLYFISPEALNKTFKKTLYQKNVNLGDKKTQTSEKNWQTSEKSHKK